MNTKLVDGQKYEVKEIVGYGSCLIPILNKEPDQKELWEEFIAESGNIKYSTTLYEWLKNYNFERTDFGAKELVSITFAVVDKSVRAFYHWTGRKHYTEERILTPDLRLAFKITKVQ